MKICWDNIKDARLTKHGKLQINKYAYHEIDACGGCRDGELKECI